MSASESHREVERKFRVPSGFTLPDFAGIPGVATVAPQPDFTMRNDYYDTADLRLFRWGITLRRREGGPDAGWHLKLPVVGERDGVRDEIRTPLSEELPAALANIVTPFVRQGTLDRVAGLRTHRAPTLLVDGAGTPRVEVVDDHVDIIGGTSFREIEAEAIPTADGSIDEDLLERVGSALLEAGATPGTTSKAGAALGPRAAVPAEIEDLPWPSAAEPAGDVVRAYLAQHARRLLLADLDLRRDLPDAVHQMRVSARRLRSGLRTFGPLIDREWADSLRRELGWMASGLGAARDTEVLRERLDDHAARLDHDDAARARSIIDHALDRRMAGALGEVAGIVDSARYIALLEDLVDGVRRLPLTGRAAEPAAEALPPLVAKSFRRLERRADALDLATPGPDWHEARIAAKRARYAADVVTPVLGHDMARLAARLADVTEVLGSHQDAQVAQEALRDMADPASQSVGEGAAVSPADAFALGRLHAVEQEAQMADRTQFLHLWPRVRKAARRAGAA